MEGCLRAANGSSNEVLIPWFLRFEEFEYYWGPFYLFTHTHTFSWFLMSNSSDDFGRAKTGTGAKKQVVLQREILSLLIVKTSNNRITSAINKLKRIEETLFRYVIIVLQL